MTNGPLILLEKISLDKQCFHPPLLWEYEESNPLKSGHWLVLTARCDQRAQQLRLNLVLVFSLDSFSLKIQVKSKLQSVAQGHVRTLVAGSVWYNYFQNKTPQHYERLNICLMWWVCRQSQIIWETKTILYFIFKNKTKHCFLTNIMESNGPDAL